VLIVLLTDVAIKRLKAPEKPKKVSDGRGLYLLLTTSGGKLWRWKYRVDGKEKVMSFGTYPEVTLAVARSKCEDARRLHAADIDPMLKKQSDRRAREIAAEHSFASVAKRWWKQWSAGRTENHTESVMRRLEADVFPSIGTRPICEVQSPELVAMVKGIAARGAVDIAKRALQTCGQIFRFAIAEGLAARNPATDIRPADILPKRQKENYARVDAKELPSLLRAIDAYRGTPTTRLAMKLMALTFVRTRELIQAPWEEFDLEAAEWRIPASRMKMGLPHVVPLSTQAIEVLRTLRLVTGHSELLFPGERDHEKSISNNTILGALKRMGYQGRMTGHGFRGVASTLLHELGYDHAHIEVQLAHQERDETSAAYNHARYLAQRRKMMQEWGDHLDGMRREN